MSSPLYPSRLRINPEKRWGSLGSCPSNSFGWWNRGAAGLSERVAWPRVGGQRVRGARGRHWSCCSPRAAPVAHLGFPVTRIDRLQIYLLVALRISVLCLCYCFFYFLAQSGCEVAPQLTKPRCVG